jgi:DMSO/TMAO reductase YedYZ molybdopterin-dependent catalytic subunit
MDIHGRDGRHSRRELLKMTPLLTAGVLAWPAGRRWLLEHGSSLSDAAAAAIGGGGLAPTFVDRDVTPLDRFPVNSYLTDDPEIDLADWRLEVSGQVTRATEMTLDAIRQLPKRVQNTRHLCVEGWEVIGAFGGTPLASFLDRIGAARNARFLEVGCADDYYESIDMATARHPQSLLCYEMSGVPLTRAHGAPLRLVLPTKLGYKQPKYIVSLAVTNVLTARRGYWVDQGYPWHGGL